MSSDQIIDVIEEFNLDDQAVARVFCPCLREWIGDNGDGLTKDEVATLLGRLQACEDWAKGPAGATFTHEEWTAQMPAENAVDCLEHICNGEGASYTFILDMIRMGNEDVTGLYEVLAAGLAKELLANAPKQTTEDIRRVANALVSIGLAAKGALWAGQRLAQLNHAKSLTPESIVDSLLDRVR